MDPTAARSLFPLTKQFIFLNHAGVSPMSERAKAALEHLMERLVTRPYPEGLAAEESERLRQSIGRLVGAGAESIRLVRNTADGMSLLAQGLDWRPGDNLVGPRVEHPDVPWMALPWTALRDRGVEYRVAEPVGGRFTAELLLSLVDGHTRVVALGHVGSWNGHRIDLEEIGWELRRRGVVFAVDARQSAGALRLDLQSLPVDFASAAASKWLLGPQGIGFCYCRPELDWRLRLRPADTLTPGSDRDHNAAAGTAAGMEESSMSVLEMTAFRAAVDLLLEVGAEQLERRVLDLSRRLAAGLAERGHEIVEPWPRGPAEDSGIVSFRRPGSSAQEVLRDLTAARVVGRTQADLVRLSPHFYNTSEEIDHVLDVLAPGGVSVG